MQNDVNYVFYAIPTNQKQVKHADLCLGKFVCTGIQRKWKHCINLVLLVRDLIKI